MWVFTAAFVFIGIGYGFLTPNNSVALGAVSKGRLCMASSLSNLFSFDMIGINIQRSGNVMVFKQLGALQAK